MKKEGEVHFPLCCECGKEMVPTKNKKSIKMTISRRVGEQKVIMTYTFCDITHAIKWLTHQKEHFMCNITPSK